MMSPLSPVGPHYRAECKFLIIYTVLSVPTVPSRSEVYIGDGCLLREVYF